MLYKKYHRNFVRKFKMGAKFKYYDRFGCFSFYTVALEPQYSMINHYIEFLSNRSRDSKITDMVLVSPRGSINDNIKIVKNSRRECCIRNIIETS